MNICTSYSLLIDNSVMLFLSESIVLLQGMLHSRGELLLMLDADGATKVTDLEKLENRVGAMLLYDLWFS